MIFPKNYEEVAALIQSEQRVVFIFMTNWCGDCHYIQPHLADIEATFPDTMFVQLDRDEYMPLAQEWGIFGIPSFVLVENGQEIRRFVDKNRKTKSEIIEFLKGIEK
ncbi:thioredoxin family protein [Streptococcus suis]|nr:thioredoxin family protein [Streptococcus suis]